VNWQFRRAVPAKSFLKVINSSFILVYGWIFIDYSCILICFTRSAYLAAPRFHNNCHLLDLCCNRWWFEPSQRSFNCLVSFEFRNRQVFVSWTTHCGWYVPRPSDWLIAAPLSITCRPNLLVALSFS
jgi:hypothetical protein